MGQVKLTLLAIGVSRTVEICHIPRIAFEAMLEMFTRSQLRDFARKMDIPRGRNKESTVKHLVTSMNKL